MPQPTARPTRRLICTALLVLPLAAGCATNRVTSHEANPEYSGEPLRSVMVFAISYDKVMRRVYEDRMVARFGERGIRAVPSYASIEKGGEIEETVLRDTIAKAGVDGILISRPGAIDRSKTRVSGGTLAVGTGGYGGFYGYYNSVWRVTEYAPTDIRGSAWMSSTTQLFDARSGTAIWTGTVETSMEKDVGPAVDKYVDLVFRTMVADKVIR